MTARLRRLMLIKRGPVRLVKAFPPRARQDWPDAVNWDRQLFADFLVGSPLDKIQLHHGTFLLGQLRLALLIH